MTLFETYDAILALGASEARAERVAAMRAAFEARTGAFAPEDPWFEARSRAFWDDAVTSQGFAREVAEAVPAGARVWVPRLERAHRGLFRVEKGTNDPRSRVLLDLWSGASFLVHAIDDALQDALAAASAPFDGRLVGSFDPLQVALLPGAVFHPADAAEPITAVLARARAEGRSGPDVLDALLRMERGLRASARVKAAYAYRADRLGAPPRGGG
ncbi:MAG TPA: hypothetical protein VGI39_03660 [Polyangiaceae bacterium]|jgi:hypothetical protein